MDADVLGNCPRRFPRATAPSDARCAAAVSYYGIEPTCFCSCRCHFGAPKLPRALPATHGTSTNSTKKAGRNSSSSSSSLKLKLQRFHYRTCPDPRRLRDIGTSCAQTESSSAARIGKRVARRIYKEKLTVAASFPAIFACQPSFFSSFWWHSPPFPSSTPKPCR